MTANNPTTYWSPSTALHKLESRHNNAPCILTDGPAEFNDVALVRLADHQRLQADHERLQAECERLQAECEKLRRDAEATRKSVKLLNYLFARNIIAMQSAVIEWEKGKGAAAGMQWIWNTLFGPGQIPDEDETDAQAYFDREIEPLDTAMQSDVFPCRAGDQP